jgi:hypothetical protein
MACGGVEETKLDAGDGGSDASDDLGDWCFSVHLRIDSGTRS